MKVITGEIYKLAEAWPDTGCEYGKISFPTDPEGNDYTIVDTLPCDKEGKAADGYEIGVPMNTDNFLFLERGADEWE